MAVFYLFLGPGSKRIAVVEKKRGEKKRKGGLMKEELERFIPM